jgi:23S rRNA pseudouridine2605 synthase
MAKRNTGGSSSGRRGSSRANSGGSSSGRGKSTGRPFKNSGDKSSGRSSSSFNRDDKGSTGNRSGQGRPFKSSKPYGKREEGSSEGGKRPYGNKRGGDFEKRSTEGRPFKKSFGRKDAGGSSARGSFGDKRGGDRSGPRSFGKLGNKPFRSRSDRSDSRGGSFENKKSFSKDADRPYKKFDKPFDKKDEGSSDKRSFGSKRSSFSKDGDKPYKKFDKPFDKKDEGSSDKTSFSSKRRSFSKDTEKPFKRSDSREARDDRKDSGSERPSSPSRFSNKSESPSYSRPERGEKPAASRRESSGVKKERSSFAGKRPRRDKVAEDAAPKSDKIRLNRYIANSGICSRREADELITMGLVSVNGKTVTELGYKVNPGDEVRYENKVLKAEKPVYILMNKPKGYLTTTDDPQERNTVMHIIGGAVKERIYPVGRLDRNTTGLLLLTNDGDLADKLMHPSHNAKKIYKVELDRPLTKMDFQAVKDGVMLEEGRAIVDDLAIISDDGRTVGVEIHIGWNRVIRRIFESLSYEVVKLDRSVYAGLDKKNLARGQWRFLTKEELVLLKHYK